MERVMNKIEQEIDSANSIIAEFNAIDFSKEKNGNFRFELTRNFRDLIAASYVIEYFESVKNLIESYIQSGHSLEDLSKELNEVYTRKLISLSGSVYNKSTNPISNIEKELELKVISDMLEPFGILNRLKMEIEK